jgi:hypothetical protein
MSLWKKFAQKARLGRGGRGKSEKNPSLAKTLYLIYLPWVDYGPFHNLEKWRFQY